MQGIAQTIDSWIIGVVAYLSGAVQAKTGFDRFVQAKLLIIPLMLLFLGNSPINLVGFILAALFAAAVYIGIEVSQRAQAKGNDFERRTMLVVFRAYLAVILAAVTLLFSGGLLGILYNVLTYGCLLAIFYLPAIQATPKAE